MDEKDLENIYINESDGLSNAGGVRQNGYHQIERRLNGTNSVNGHSTGSAGEEESENSTNNPSRNGNGNSDDEIADIPKSLIVTGLDIEFFDDQELRGEFEQIFNSWGECTYQYFKSFKRVRVNYNNSESSINARLNGHLLKIGESTVNCYFCIGTQVKSDRKKTADGYLHPPTPDKQFLISPPASPPVDWEPRPEGVPNINFDLIAALSQLSPGEAHELHKPISDSHPSIVVHIAAAPTAVEKTAFIENITNFKIIQTKRPPVNATGAE